MTQSVTLKLPQPVFERLAQVAQQYNRSIPDAVDELVNQAERQSPLADEVERELATLATFPDEILSLLIQNPIPPAYQDELALLNDKAQREGELTTIEKNRQKYLLDYYQEAILRRSYCMEILRRRGIDVAARYLHEPSAKYE